jgi:hypothetical protein
VSIGTHEAVSLEDSWEEIGALPVVKLVSGVGFASILETLTIDCIIVELWDQSIQL